MAVPLKSFTDRVAYWASGHNPFFPPSEEFLKENPGANLHQYADILSLIPFFILMLLLYLVGRELILTTRQKRQDLR